MRVRTLDAQGPFHPRRRGEMCNQCATAHIGHDGHVRCAPLPPREGAPRDAARPSARAGEVGVRPPDGGRAPAEGTARRWRTAQRRDQPEAAAPGGGRCPMNRYGIRFSPLPGGSKARRAAVWQAWRSAVARLRRSRGSQAMHARDLDRPNVDPRPARRQRRKARKLHARGLRVNPAPTARPAKTGPARGVCVSPKRRALRAEMAKRGLSSGRQKRRFRKHLRWLALRGGAR